MSDKPISIKYLTPTELGWVRKTYEGTKTCDAWERPDGKIVLISREYSENYRIAVFTLPTIQPAIQQISPWVETTDIPPGGQT